MSLTKHPFALGRVAGGNHLVSAGDEPEPLSEEVRDAICEAARIRADLDRNVNKAPRLAARNDRAAVEADLIQFRARGYI